jgi:hypothetical protein
MRKLTTATIGAACLVLGAGGATLYTQAATGPAFYAVYEANVTDEDAYKKALPDAQNPWQTRTSTLICSLRREGRYAVSKRATLFPARATRQRNCSLSKADRSKSA